MKARRQKQRAPPVAHQITTESKLAKKACYQVGSNEQRNARPLHVSIIQPVYLLLPISDLLPSNALLPATALSPPAALLPASPLSPEQGAVACLLPQWREVAHGHMQLGVVSQQPGVGHKSVGQRLPVHCSHQQNQLHQATAYSLQSVMQR